MHFDGSAKVELINQGKLYTSMSGFLILDTRYSILDTRNLHNLFRIYKTDKNNYIYITPDILILFIVISVLQNFIITV